MIIRPAILTDRSAIFGLAKEQARRYPKLKMDVEKTHSVLAEVIRNSRHFAWVVEVEGVVVGALLALTSDNLWAQRHNSNISLWVSKAPGGGIALLREFRKWIKPRRAIKVAGICPDLDLDPRALKLAERVGFERTSGAYLLYN